METRMLFNEDPYLTGCQAHVTSIEGNKITLDQTCFFAFSGGQESDSGIISGIEVESAVKDRNQIYYYLSKDPNFSIGDPVSVQINPEKRNKIRMLHSAIHYLGFIIEKKIGLTISDMIGSNVDSKKGRLDFNSEESLGPYIEMLKNELNDLLSRGLEIKITETSKGRYEWESNGWKCPCGGTHPQNSSEIGNVKLKRKNIGKGKERVEAYLENGN